MKTIKVSEATSIQLDWLVAKCEGETLSQASLAFQIKEHGCLQRPHLGSWKPSTSWAQGGPIIEREGIDIQQLFGGGCEGSFSQPVGWQAKRYVVGGVINPPYFNAQTPLIAGMRCYVASRLGDEVDVPEELAALVKGE